MPRGRSSAGSRAGSRPCCGARLGPPTRPTWEGATTSSSSTPTKCASRAASSSRRSTTATPATRAASRRSRSGSSSSAVPRRSSRPPSGACSLTRPSAGPASAGSASTAGRPTPMWPRSRCPSTSDPNSAREREAMAVAPLVMTSGGRKEAVARVRLIPGTGKITVNDRPVEEYFPRPTLLTAVREPLVVAGAEGRFDVVATVRGGGIAGQAGAIRLGIARALLAIDGALRPALRKAGLLTRDPRMKERKKYGHKRARKGFQYSERWRSSHLSGKGGTSPGAPCGSRRGGSVARGGRRLARVCRPPLHGGPGGHPLPDRPPVRGEPPPPRPGERPARSLPDPRRSRAVDPRSGDAGAGPSALAIRTPLRRGADGAPPLRRAAGTGGVRTGCHPGQLLRGPVRGHAVQDRLLPRPHRGRAPAGQRPVLAGPDPPGRGPPDPGPRAGLAGHLLGRRGRDRPARRGPGSPVPGDPVPVGRRGAVGCRLLGARVPGVLPLRAPLPPVHLRPVDGGGRCRPRGAGSRGPRVLRHRRERAVPRGHLRGRRPVRAPVGLRRPRGRRPAHGALLRLPLPGGAAGAVRGPPAGRRGGILESKRGRAAPFSCVQEEHRDHGDAPRAGRDGDPGPRAGRDPRPPRRRRRPQGASARRRPPPAPGGPGARAPLREALPPDPGHLRGGDAPAGGARDPPGRPGGRHGHA